MECLTEDKRRVVGYNSAVGTTLEDVCELGVNVVPLPTVATSMELVSSSANDSPNGTGAREIEVRGLDKDYKEIEEHVLMNGTTVVTLKKQYIRINGLHSLAVGSNGVAVGNITLQSIGGATVYNKISLGGNMSLQCHFTVPDNKVARLVGWSAGLITTKKDTVARAILRATADPFEKKLVKGVFIFHDIITGQNDTVAQGLTEHELITFYGRTDVKISAQQMQGTGATESTGRMLFEYV